HDIDGLLELLATLFVPIRSAADNMRASRSMLADVGNRRGVGHIDYFDRYFSFGVPSDDTADHEIRTALERLGGPDSSDAAAVLADALRRDPDRTLRKIGASLADRRTPSDLIVVLGATYGQLPARTGFVSNPRIAMEMLAAELLPSMGGGALDALRTAASDDDGLYFASVAMARAN